MNTPTSALSPGSGVGAPRRQSAGSENGKGEVETNGIDRWAVAGEKLTADKKLTEDAKKDLVEDIISNLRRLLEDINEDNWMYDPIDLGYSSTGQQGR
ncbi:unnamed protein product [Ascophyllum nodosum]